jgi:aminoglycoside 6-adenylyltransferase
MEEPPVAGMARPAGGRVKAVAPSIAAMDQGRVLADVVAWAEGEDDIRLVVVTGSVARGPNEVHPLSDLDVELYTRRPDALLEETEWYRRFGEVLAVEALENPGWNPTRLVYYVDGKIDFMIGSLEVLEHGVTYERPYRVVLDEDGLAGRLRSVSRPMQPPSREEFRRCIDWFAAAALMTAKDVVRDEPWKAKMRDSDLKDELLTMIEWDHRARYGWEYDTWHLGLHMRGWMDADVQADLERCWARFALDDTRAALLASVELFARLSDRTSSALGFAGLDEARIRAELERILATAP